MTIEKATVNKLQKKLNHIVMEEKNLLPKLRELSYEGIDLETKALDYKEITDSLTSESNQRMNKKHHFSDEERKNIHANVESLQEELIKSKQLLEDISKLKTHEEFYKAVQEDFRFETYVPLVTCANDYVEQQLILFKEKNDLKFFSIYSSKNSKNHLPDILISSKIPKFSLPDSLLRMDLVWKDLNIKMDSFKENQSDAMFIDDSKLIDSIYQSLNRITELTDLMKYKRTSKYLIGKKKRAIFEANCYTKIENEKQKIYSTYSRILSAKDTLEKETQIIQSDVSLKQESEMKEELLNIINFLDEKLHFKLNIGGNLFNGY